MLLELVGRLFPVWVCVHCTLIFLCRLQSTWPPSSTLWTTVSVSAWTSLMWVLSLPTFLLSGAPMLRCDRITLYSSWEKAETWESLTFLFVSGIPLLFLTLPHSITQGSLPTECRACLGHLPGRSHCLLSHHQSVLSSLWRTVICLWLLPQLCLKKEPLLCFRAKWPSAWSVPQSQVAVGGQFPAVLPSKTVVPFCLVASVSLDGGDAVVVP